MGGFRANHAFFGRMSDRTVELSKKLIEVSPSRTGGCFLHQLGLRGERHAGEDAVVPERAGRAARTSQDPGVTRINGYQGVTVVSALDDGKPYNSVFGLPLPGFTT